MRPLGERNLPGDDQVALTLHLAILAHRHALAGDRCRLARLHRPKRHRNLQLAPIKQIERLREARCAWRRSAQRLDERELDARLQIVPVARKDGVRLLSRRQKRGPARRRPGCSFPACGKRTFVPLFHPGCTVISSTLSSVPPLSRRRPTLSRFTPCPPRGPRARP